MWILAGLWGLAAGSALLIGAAAGFFLKVGQRLIAFVMAFGSGVLISALSFNLMQEAYDKGGFLAVSIGFLLGAGIFSAGNYLLSLQGAKHRMKAGRQQPSEEEKPGSGLAIALGSLMDSIPESIAIGVSMIHGGGVEVATVIAIFLSNLPEGMSSSSGMKKAGRSARYVFGLWLTIALLTGVASLLGYVLFSKFSPVIIAGTLAFAAGAILAMLSNTMIPEAYKEAPRLIGLITVIGFLCAFMISKLF